MKRSEAIEHAERNGKYTTCGTCKNYQRLIICGECSRGSRYSFDWKEYIKEYIKEEEK